MEGADRYLKQLLSGKREAAYWTEVPWTRAPVIPVELVPFETGGDTLVRENTAPGSSTQAALPSGRGALLFPP